MAWSRSAVANLLEQFPAEEPPVPEVEKGTLMIVGGGGVSEEMWKRFIELAGGPDAPIVAIPTAGGLGEVENPRSGGARSLEKYGATNVTVLHTTIRDKSNYDEDFLEPLKEAKGVWFDGGRQWNLVDSYQNTTAHDLMMDVLVRGGVVGGSSAGASIQGDFMARGDPLGSGPIQALGYETGLGFLIGVAIDQHFHQRNRMPNMTSLMEIYPQILGIGIDESTAIFVKGTVAEVAGRNVVSFYDRRKPVIPGELDHEIVNPGEKYDLKERSVISGAKAIREIRVIK
jgi:cyanophycinase